MIVDLEHFITTERPHWEKLEATLAGFSRDPWRKISLDQARELEVLYQRAAADLARLSTYSAEPEARHYLENLVARGHAEIHGNRAKPPTLAIGTWLARTLPQTFRRRLPAFWLAVAITLGGVLFGAAAISLDPDSKEVLMPFEHLQQTPAERVAQEREDAGKSLDNHKAQFSGMLMTHNTQVTLSAMALGMTWGIGTLILMFYNGVMLGAVALDYILGGQTVFLIGWLLPHGAVEIPAILVGGQAGFVLAGAILGRGERRSLVARMRAAAPDVVTLCFGAALMLVWAGIVEAFLSQYHEPVIPYVAKIGFGCVELVALIWSLFYAGSRGADAKTET